MSTEACYPSLEPLYPPNTIDIHERHTSRIEIRPSTTPSSSTTGMPRMSCRPSILPIVRTRTVKHEHANRKTA